MLIRPGPRDERGIALLVAIFALVIIGALVGGVFFMAQLEERSGGNALSGLQAGEAAQAGLEYAAANWQWSWVQQGVGRTTGLGYLQIGSSVGYFSDSITQLNDELALIRSFGQARNGSGVVQASRTFGMLFKVASPDFGIAAAVTVDGAVNVGGKDTVSGVDIVPSGGAWAANCATFARNDQAGARSSGSVSHTGFQYYLTPSSVSSDTSVATSVAKTNAVFSTLAGMADLTFTTASAPASVAPVLSGHACATGSGDPGNWGDPTYAPSGLDGTNHPCAGYFPVIYVNGNLTMPSGSGQGILLVNGNLTFGSAFKFYGVILATGTAKATGSSNGNGFGALLAEAGTSNLNGNERFDYSSCAVSLAAHAALIGRPLDSRASIRF
ncbi:MAG: hypothetical protein ACHQXA_01185 [Gemmatimonadales bacterium]